MAFVISAVVGAIGAAVGTAIGAAIGGTIFGISASVIGGVIGAGIAGGVLSMARGGDFGKGFLLGAAGNVLGGFIKGAFDGPIGATIGNTGDTVEGMLAAQGGAEFAPTAFEGSVGSAANAVTDAGVSTFGLGDMSAPTGTALEAVSSAPGGDLASSATQGVSSTGASLADLGTPNYASTQVPPEPGSYSEFAASQTPQMSSLSQTVSGVDPTSPTYTGGGATSAAPATATLGSDTGGGGSADTGGSWDSSAHAVNPPDGTTNASMLNSQGGATSTPSGNIIEGGNTPSLWDKAKTAWNDNMPKGSLQKTIMGGGQFLYDQYNLHKLDKINKGMRPLSFEDWKKQYAPGQEAQYSAASNQMARSGHTGTLPALLASMNKDAIAGYSKYLPGAQTEQYNRTSDLQAAKQRSLSNLTYGIGRTAIGGAA